VTLQAAWDMIEAQRAERPALARKNFAALSKRAARFARETDDEKLSRVAARYAVRAHWRVIS